MKREGYQHGMVKSCTILPSPWAIPRSKSKIVNKLDSPPTAGLFVKVSSKPTNHSKFTGKCGKPGCNECHAHPANKSKDKAKGNHKLKASNVTMDNRSIAWKVVDKGQRLKYSGKSATGILCLMSGDDYYDDDDEIEEEEEDQEEEEVKIETAIDAGFVETEILSKEVKIETAIDAGFVETEILSKEVKIETAIDAGFVVVDQLEGDEGWYLVGDF